MKINTPEKNCYLFDSEIKRLELKENIPLSSAQKSIWFMDQLFPKSSVYNNPIIFETKGELKIPILNKAINKIIERHEILRTNFYVDNNEVYQRVNDFQAIKPTIIDISRINDYEVEKETKKIISREVNRPFDLERDCLFRVNIIKKSLYENLVIFTFHHIIADGWSLGLFLDEISNLYSNLVSNLEIQLPALDIQYSDYAIWQQSWLRDDNEKVIELLDFWKTNLADYPTNLQLPLDNKRSNKPSYNGSTKIKKINKKVTNELREFNKANNVSMFLTCLTAFTVLIHRYTDQNDILVGVPTANRNKIEIENMFGHFVNTLVIRSRNENNPRFKEHLQDIKNTVLDSFEHQDLPFEKLVEVIKPERVINHNPLFQVAFSYQKKESSSLYLKGLEVLRVNESSDTSKVDIYMVIEEDDEEINVAVEYNQDILTESSITRLLSQFDKLIKNIVVDSSINIADIPLLSKEEEQQIIEGFNNSFKDFNQNKYVHELFEEQVSRNPNQIACFFDGKTLTYDELNQRSNIVAHYLLRRGIAKDNVVGICINRSLDMVVALLGVLKAGGAYLPIDPFQPQERIDLIINDANPKVILTKENLKQFFKANNKKVINLDTINFACDKLPNPDIKMFPSNLAYIIYTSGTTGKPKGVLLNHIGLTNLASTEMKTYNITSESRILHVASFAFDSALYGLLLALTQGARLYIASLDKLSNNTNIIEMINKWGITYTNLTPSILKAFNPNDVPTLKTIVSYGEELTSDLVKKWSVKNRRIFNGYGPTETTVGATISECTVESEKAPTIGIPFNNYKVYVLDKKLKPLPINIPGEIYIGGVGLARGYLNLPALTAEKFIPDPFSSKKGQRMYRTGDMGRYRENGELEFLGRIDSQVKIRGYRIELRDIEHTLLTLPAIGNVIVDQLENEGDKKLAAYIVKKDGHEITESEIYSYLKVKLPEYMIPTFFVFLDFIPLTSGGKLDKKSLPQIEYKRFHSNEHYIEPNTETEKTIHYQWKELLKFDDISINDNFFEIGGHSLLVAQLTFMIRKKFNLDIPMNVLFENPTISGMGKIIDYAKSNGIENLNKESEEDNLLSEVNLDHSIWPENNFELQKISNENILLTGVTGFVGAYLLSNLIKNSNSIIYCLIRAENEDEAQQKLKENMTYYGLWKDSIQSRIKILIGDLSKPFLGLSRNLFSELAVKIDQIYHNGALVNLTFPYIATKGPNVEGTIEIIKLACKSKTKPIHFTSTLSVFSDKDDEVYEDDTTKNSIDISTGYSKSKWVAEQILKIARERGVPVSIYRLGRVFGSSDTGICQPNDFLWKFIEACTELQMVPKIDEYFDVSPVDIVAKSIITLSRDSKNFMKTFHIMNDNQLHFDTILSALKEVGYELSVVDNEVWVKKFKEFCEQKRDKDQLSTISLLLQNSENSTTVPSLVINGEYTKKILFNYGISNLPINKNLLTKTIRHFIKAGYFRNPN